MLLEEPLRELSSIVPENLSQLQRHMDPEWIQGALKYSGAATLRRRRLPGEQVIWLVIGMALMRNRSIHEVVSKLDLALAGMSPTVAPSSVPPARMRLGAEPLAWLFQTSAEHWAHESARAHMWRGLALYGADGSSFRVQDTPENAEMFGYASCNGTTSGLPVMRFAALVALRSHLIAATSFGPYKESEQSLAESLWPKIPDDSLTILDRYYLSAKTLGDLTKAGTNRHWLVRAKQNTQWAVVERYGPNDALVELKTSYQARVKDPTLPTVWRARAITYETKGFRPAILLTSLLDPKRYPAKEIASLYCERWEHEQAYDELKTQMLDTDATLRSKTPKAVEQELWGILIAFNLVRLEILRVADEAGVEPTRISFTAVYHFICDEWLWCAVASPGAIPKHLQRLRESVRHFILPPRRKGRTYPRAVKARLTKYPTKRSLCVLGAADSLK